ncbi:MAG: hypothetical protein ABEL76_06475, partial [Bradymonadaceae bacterium]
VFVLKPTLRYILRGRFAAIRGQVGYKLDRLLMLRNEGPAAPETLFGDDAEQDAFIYSLYADLAAGRVRPDYLRRVLAEADVHPKAADSIAGRAAAIDVRDNVDRIFIHLEQRTPPGRFWVFGPRVVPIANYFQAAFILFTRGALTAPGAVRVGRGMVEGHGFGIRELADSLEDLFRRRHLEVDELERFREGLREWEDTPDEVLDFADEFIDRARNLAPLETETPHRATGPPDYIDLLRSDRALRESVRDEAG